MGGKFHLKLNIDERPIANKYREGKMKRTLERESNVLKIAERELIGISRSLCGSLLSGSGWIRLVVFILHQFGSEASG